MTPLNDVGCGSSSSAATSDDDERRYILPEEVVAQVKSDDDGGVLPPTGIDAAESEHGNGVTSALPGCSSILNSVKELYGYLLLRGARQLSEEQYTVVREGLNMSYPVPLPSLTRLRERLAPGVLPWTIPASTFELQMKGKDGKVSVQCILPSSHVRRAVAFAATYQKLFEAEERSEDELALHPDFFYSPFYTCGSRALDTGRALQRFIIDGVCISLGDSFITDLSPPLSSPRVVATCALFASHRSGVAHCNEVRAGDLVVTCTGDGDDEMRGSLVARHRMASELPLLSWSPQSPQSTPNAYHDVLELVLNSAEDGASLGSQEEPSTSTASSPWRPKKGRRDGVTFSPVSLAMNSDDYEARRGKNESLREVCMSYISILYKDCCSSSACRTISATFPCVDSDEVLKAITSDLREDATRGWLCRRPDGTALRVFAGVAFLVGDYVQVRKTGKTMGYAAKSPCPLCVYRTPGVPGTRFGVRSSSAGADLACTTERTRSICRAVQDAVGDGA